MAINKKRRDGRIKSTMINQVAYCDRFNLEFFRAKGYSSAFGVFQLASAGSYLL